MKLQFNKTPIALALAAMLISPVAFADGPQVLDALLNGGTYYADLKLDATAEINADVNVNTNINTVRTNRDTNNTRSLDISGDVVVQGVIDINSSSAATVDDRQISYQNNYGPKPQHNGSPEEEELGAQSNGGPSNTAAGGGTNTANVGGGSLAGASGNIGVNVTAGDGNQQANAAALAVSDASFVFGSVDAEITAVQHSEHNKALYVGHTNAASLDGGALANATGNIGVNIAAGHGNQQKNDLAASIGTARMAQASVNVHQQNDHNNSTNLSRVEELRADVAVNLAFNSSGGYRGTSDQIGNVYPDIWTGDAANVPAGQQHSPHPGGSADGHFDLDTQTQGGSDLNHDGGALAFRESGNLALSGTVTGFVPVVTHIFVDTTNTASLSGGALVGASGNIGVNIASGTFNQQYNGLAIAATNAPTRPVE